jgi:hypothetical protein
MAEYVLRRPTREEVSRVIAIAEREVGGVRPDRVVLNDAAYDAIDHCVISGVVVERSAEQRVGYATVEWKPRHLPPPPPEF